MNYNINFDFEAVYKLGASMEYQSCCTRKNCALTCLWFLVDFCMEHYPHIAQFAPFGGCFIFDIMNFSLMYSMLTNTEKKKPSKSNFGYTCRQNLHNHFILVMTEKETYYFYHEHFREQYRSIGKPNYTYMKNVMLPWKRSLNTEQIAAVKERLVKLHL